MAMWIQNLSCFFYFWIIVTQYACTAHVTELSSQTLYSFRNENKDLDLVVYFHYPKNEICQSFEPIFTAFGAKWHDKVHIAKIDTSKDTIAPVMFGLQTYPTVVLLDKDQDVYWEYDGPGNTPSDLGQWALAAQSEDGKPNPQDHDAAGFERYQEIISVMRENGMIGEDGLPAGKTAPPEETNEVVEGAEAVVVLTDDNWQQKLKDGKGAWMVEFYAPWCGHCKMLAPIYATLAVKLEGETNVHVAKVDATQNEQFSEMFEVQGYPTVVVIVDNMVYDYDGERTVESMEEFLKGGYNKVEGKPLNVELVDDGPSVVQTMTNENIDDVYVGSWFLEFYVPWCGHCKKLGPQYEKAARKMKEMDKGTVFAKIDATAEKTLAKRFNITAYPTLMLVVDEKMYNYPHDGGRKADQLVDWVVSNDYKKEKPKTVPPRPTFAERVQEGWDQLLLDLRVLWAMKKLSLGIIFSFGVVVGAFLIALCTPAPKRRRPAGTKAKTQDTSSKSTTQSKAKKN